MNSIYGKPDLLMSFEFEIQDTYFKENRSILPN